MNQFNQPDSLKTDKYVSSFGGRGNDVWNMLVSCITGNVNMVRNLLNKQPSLANCNFAYFSPLHFAVREGHADIVDILLMHNADATAISGISWQDSPLQKAKDRGYSTIINMLETHLQRTLHSNSLGDSIAALIKEGKDAELKRWITEHPDAIYSTDERGNTALHWAVLTRQVELIDFLIEKGVDMEAKRADGCKVVHLALEGDYFYRSKRDLPKGAIQNPWFLLGYLISKGAHYDIYTASAVGDTEYIREVLLKEPSQVKNLDSSGRSALYYAAKNGNVQSVKVLLEHNADPTEVEKDAPRGAALHAASSNNHLSIARMLLTAGADPNAEVEASGNALFIATLKGHTEMTELLYTAGASLSLSGACALGRVDLVGEITAVKPSEINAGDFGPLAQAVSEGYTNIVHLLLKHNVELNDPWYTSNYMSYALRFSDKDMVTLLLEHGANPNLTNWLGVSYLHVLALQGNIELAKLLIDFGADLNVIDNEHSTTPLGWAAKYGKKEMVAFLLGQGAKRDLTGMPDWATPMEWAKRRGHPEIVDMLS